MRRFGRLSWGQGFLDTLFFLYLEQYIKIFIFLWASSTSKSLQPLSMFSRTMSNRSSNSLWTIFIYLSTRIKKWNVQANILSNETIDNLSEELLASERFLNASANTLSVIGVCGPKIMASVIALAVVCRGVYATLKPNNDSEEEEENSDSEEEDSGVKDN